MAGWFELKRSEAQFFFNFVGANGEPLLTSERYVTKSDAEGGIASVKTNAGVDARYEKKSSLSGQPYFVLRAVNRSIIGTSQMYSSAKVAGGGDCIPEGERPVRAYQGFDLVVWVPAGPAGAGAASPYSECGPGTAGFPGHHL